MTFTMIRKSDDTLFTVYSIRNDKTGYPHFLIYEDNQWKWQSVKYFVPTEEAHWAVSR